MTVTKVNLFSKEFYGRVKEDPDYIDVLAIKALLDRHNIPYEHIADEHHVGDPQVRLEEFTYTGVKEVRDNLFWLKRLLLSQPEIVTMEKEIIVCFYFLLN